MVLVREVHKISGVPSFKVLLRDTELFIEVIKVTAHISQEGHNE